METVEGYLKKRRRGPAAAPWLVPVVFYLCIVSIMLLGAVVFNPSTTTNRPQIIAHDVVCFDSWGTSKRFPDVIRATHTAGAWDMEYAAGERGVYVQLAGETCWYEVEKRADNTAHRPSIKSQTP